MDIAELFELTKTKQASDLLLTAGAPPVLRIHGNLTRTDFPPLIPKEVKQLVYSLLSEDQRLVFEREKELDFSLGMGAEHRFRVNVYLQKGCVAAAFRPIPNTIPKLKDLGLPPLVYDLAFSPQGLILVTGPTGHGKSTTQASIIDLINTNKRCHIISVEDPIEYVHQNKNSIVDQRELGGDTLSFSTALKYVLRQDPDVILIGEMRDLDTIQAALTAAETGHLVLATLHTNDAVQTIDRIIDVFPQHQQQQVRVQLSLTLSAVVSQRLLPKKSGNGRVLAVELLKNVHSSANLIREGKSHQLYSVIETGSKDGMTTMDASLIRLYQRGIITMEEAQLHMRNPQALLEMELKQPTNNKRGD
ncbi:MAG: type IV pilus twitching motility protein PilT [Candidatus Omnitrophota bacterium]|jgi:twitching motility protein PilT|nr:MAG: type IV pilus twitching motility protein PilT [Candidatus Omnitrophota bacterium]